MRKIQSVEEAAKKQRRNKIAVGIVFIFLLIFSSAGFAFHGFGTGGGSRGGGGPDLGEDIGEGFSLQFNGEYWIYNVEGQQFYLSDHYRELEDISVNSAKNLGDFISLPLYISSENQDELNKISFNLGRYASRIQEACHESCEQDLPEIECESGENLIVFIESEEDKIYDGGSCVFIEGSGAAVDAFLFDLLGFDQYTNI